MTDRTFYRLAVGLVVMAIAAAAVIGAHQGMCLAHLGQDCTWSQCGVFSCAAPWR